MFWQKTNNKWANKNIFCIFQQLSFIEVLKGHLISKCLFGDFNFPDFNWFLTVLSCRILKIVIWDLFWLFQKSAGICKSESVNRYGDNLYLTWNILPGGFPRKYLFLRNCFECTLGPIFSRYEWFPAVMLLVPLYKWFGIPCLWPIFTKTKNSSKKWRNVA